MVTRRLFMSAIGDKIKEKRTTWMPFLESVGIFASNLSDYDRGLLTDALAPCIFEKGAVITRAGHMPSQPLFYLLRDGTVEETTAGPSGVQRKLQPGDFFGEVELLQKSPCQATRVAKTRAVCATLTADQFVKMVPLHALATEGKQQKFALAVGGGPRERGRRYGQSAEATSAARPQTPSGTRKSTEAIARIMHAVKNQKIFSRLNEEQLVLLQQTMREHKVPAGTSVISQGEKGNHFYVVDSGELDAFVQSEPSKPAAQVKSFGPGDSFGELALMYNCPRTASIVTRTDAVLWSVDRVSFRGIVLEANTRKAAMYEAFLEKVQLLEPLTKEQRNRMVDVLEEVEFNPNETIIREGDAGTHFYIVVEGHVSITKSGQEGELARRGVGDYFGELSLKTGAPTIASVAAIEEKCKLVRMDRGAFLRLLGPLDSLLALRKYTATGQEVSVSSADAAADALKELTMTAADEYPGFTFQRAPTGISLDQFTVTRGTLGEGAFGKVRRARDKKTGAVWALKQMCKADIVSMGQVEHIIQETQVLSAVLHPFVANKYAAITTPTNLILLLEFCPGGDMFDQLYRHKKFSVQDVSIYIMQVLLPIEYMHKQGIVHRDLKLENILVAEDGALKLTDFGFAKYIQHRSYTLCGTPEYLAPELILEKGHGKAVDYWALGILLFEMLNGHSPFEAEDHLATYQKILDGTVTYPSDMDADAIDLVSKLLQKDISRRYGNMVAGAKDIKDHKFYAHVDWSSPYGYRGSIRPAKFEPAKHDWLPALEVVTESKPLKPQDQALFASF
mmetsp:Transcript_2012/g.5431  ORF Transcript_2012/g.5431 Transcript_2012/m.5431 type:complete len:791 (-) Transcript_2012:683-3055(-)